MFTSEESKYVKWYDYFWLLIPIAGIAMFVAVVTNRVKKST